MNNSNLPDGCTPQMIDAQSIIDALTAELERERMRLAACGVVALADTVESAEWAREMHDDYKSASCGDVARRVDECIALRTERDALKAQLVQCETVALTHVGWELDGYVCGLRDRSINDRRFEEYQKVYVAAPPAKPVSERELPALPPPTTFYSEPPSAYTAAQMREYARTALKENGHDQQVPL